MTDTLKDQLIAASNRSISQVALLTIEGCAKVAFEKINSYRGSGETDLRSVAEGVRAEILLLRAYVTNFGVVEAVAPKSRDFECEESA